MRLAASRTFWTAGNKSPMRTAMMAITTSSSISVKPQRKRNRIARMGTSRGEGTGKGELQSGNLQAFLRFYPGNREYTRTNCGRLPASPLPLTSALQGRYYHWGQLDGFSGDADERLPHRTRFHG